MGIIQMAFEFIFIIKYFVTVFAVGVVKYDIRILIIIPLFLMPLELLLCV
jgi:hypothetical protein